MAEPHPLCCQIQARLSCPFRHCNLMSGLSVRCAVGTRYCGTADKEEGVLVYCCRWKWDLIAHILPHSHCCHICIYETTSERRLVLFACNVCSINVLVQATVLPNLFARLIKQLYTLVYIRIRNWCVGSNNSATTIPVMSRTHAINTIRIPT